MGYRGGLPSGKSGKPSGAGKISGGGLGMAGGRTRLAHTNQTTAPSASERDGLARTIIVGLLCLEQRQNMIGASGSPFGQQPMMVIPQSTAAADRDQPRVSNLGEDQPFSAPAPCLRMKKPCQRISPLLLAYRGFLHQMGEQQLEGKHRQEPF